MMPLLRGSSAHSPQRLLMILAVAAALPQTTLLGTLAAAAALPQTTLLIMHTPKTGGSEFRGLVFGRARQRHLSLQTDYGTSVSVQMPPSEGRGVRQFNATRPADVIMGHHVDFRTLQPVAAGRRLRYVTITRSPTSWFLSLYLHMRETKATAATTLEFVRDQVRGCPTLRRDANATTCTGHLYSWHAGGVAADAPDRCSAFVALFTRPHNLILVNERMADSVWLLFRLLDWGRPPAISHANTRDRRAYDKKVPLAALREIDQAVASTCMPDIWASSHRRFERVHGVARAFARGHPGTPLGALAERLWPPLGAAT